MSETLADIGEFGLIHRIDVLLREQAIETPGLTLGIGDDAASFRLREGHECLVTCDCIVEGRHFLSQYIRPLELGRRAMALNISDIGAMGGNPLYAIISLGLKSSMPVEYVEAIYRGFVQELQPFQASVIGGNITKVDDAMFIDITLIGEVRADRMLRRSTAKKGDVILVTGYPGQAAAGLELLLRNREYPGILNHPLVKAYHLPAHRAREGRAVAELGCATAMIDTSDGFLGDLGHICEESGVSALLFQEDLPVSSALKEAAGEMGKDPYSFVMGDSDDYELIITCPAIHVAEIKKAVAAVSQVNISMVGTLSEPAEALTLVLPDGKKQKIRPGGWDHFSNGGV